MHSLGKTLLAFPLLHFVLQGQNLEGSLDPTFAFQSPMMKRTSVLVLVLEGLVGLRRTFQFIFFSVTGRSIDLDYCNTEWFALEMNRDHSVTFEIASKYCISDSFVDYNGYPISFKGFLSPVVDIIHPFQSILVR